MTFDSYFETDPEAETITVSNESYDVAWIELDRVHRFNAEDSIMRMVNKTKML